MQRRGSSALIAVSFVATAWAVSGCNDDNSNNQGLVPGACTPVGSVARMARMATQARIAPQARSHIPSVVARYADTGKVSDGQFINVTVALQMNNEADLDSRIAEMYDPRSANYRKFMTPEEFRARYAPSQEQVDRAKNYLESHGIAAVSVNNNGYLIHAVGQASTLNEAFQTELHHYRDAESNTYFAPSVEPQMPVGSPIRAVHGLHDVARRKPFVHQANAVTAHIGSGPNGGLSPLDVRRAYNLPSGVNGSGQTLALVELDGYNSNDIAAYEYSFGLPQVPLQNVLIDGFSGAPGQSADEVTMDIELMVAIAPGASRILVYEAPNTDQGILDIYSRIANDNAARQVSTSWGSPESANTTTFLETENVIFKQMAAQGQSFYAASGDLGAYDNGSTLSVSDPSSQPFVVAVGGTHLDIGPGGTYQGEYVWNNGSPQAGAGGGGVSAIWQQPGWQTGVANSGIGVSSTRRNIPDVSLNSDPSSGYSIYYRGGWVIYAGTSAAAPLWAGFTALVNQARAGRGLGALGFPNPAIYSIGSSNRYGSDFHDIVNGNNLYYPASPGFDNATGWGSFNGQGLFDDLSNTTIIAEQQLSC